jgi:hypothetical protein
LTEAVNAKTGVLISVDGTEVIPASQWVTQFVMDTFNGKINDAQSVQANPGTQAAVNAAISALDAAIGGFNAAKKPGTYVPPVDKTALIAAINAAEQARAGVAQSNDNGFTLPSGSVYVTIGAWNTFAGVITTAIGIRDNNNATQTQVDDAVAALTAATGSFNTAKQTAVVDRSALNAAIGLAEGARTGIERSTNGGTDIPKNEQWVTPAVWTAFDNAVTAARTVWASSAASQKQVNDAKNALEAAQTVFTGNIKPGLRDDTSTKLTVKNIDHTKDELLYLNLYPVNGGATLELVKKGTTSVVPYQGTRSFDNIPEGSYRLRYRCSSSGTILYPSSAGIVIRLKGGYETYLELPGNGEVPRADIKRIDGGPITGTSTFNLINNYTSNVTSIALYPKELGYFASELSGGIRMSATITAAYWDGNSGALKSGGTMNNPFNVAPGVYWLRVWTSATARYSYDTTRWLPVFAFPGESIRAIMESGGVKLVEYK